VRTKILVAKPNREKSTSACNADEIVAASYDAAMTKQTCRCTQCGPCKATPRGLLLVSAKREFHLSATGLVSKDGE